ncbi:MAG: hypothetical protein R3D62_01120 [Xanthobacteraceae bacterium]
MAPGVPAIPAYIALMDDRYSDRKPEQPRSEPEIIPPGRDDVSWTDAVRGGGQRSDFFIAFDEDGRTRYTTFKPPGPFTIWLALIVIGLVGAAVLMLALGFVLFLIPVVGIAIAALVLSGQIRAWWRRLGHRGRQ